MTAKKIKSSLKPALLNIPVLGYVLKVIWYGVTLPTRQAENIATIKSLSEQLEEQQHSISQINASNEDISNSLLSNTNYLTSTTNQLADIKHQLLLLASRDFNKGTSKSKSIEHGTGSLFVDNHSLDKFYVDLENKFRGDEEDIKNRLSVYIPYFKRFSSNYKKHPVLDIGCGRGEMLHILKENDINALGIDLNESMVTHANELGYKAIQAEALTYLLKQKSGSLSAITGFHIVEHIPFDILIRLFEECYRVLVPGGFIIFETPNPENVVVGSFSFYMDPSHLHPLPPDLLAFAFDSAGFSNTEIKRLHPAKENISAEPEGPLKDVLNSFYGPRDYAVIAYKST